MQKDITPYNEFGYYIHRVVALIDKRGGELFRANLGISLRQFLLLRLIEANTRQAPSQQAVADRLGIAKSAVSRHIEIAQKNGWLEATVSDTSRRQKELVLTKKGKALLKKAKKLLKQVEADGFGDGITDEDIKTTLKVLRALYDKLQ